MTLAPAEQTRSAASAGASFRPFGLSKLSVRLLLLVLLAAVPVLAVEAYYELQLREERRAEVSQQVEHMADLVAGQLDRMIEGAQTVLVTLGQFPSIRERDAATCNDTLIRLAARFPSVDTIGVAGPDGTSLCNSVPDSPPLNVAERPYFRRALETKSLSVSELLTGQLGGRKLIALAQPTLDDRGAVQTVLILTLDPKTMSDLLAGVPLLQGATIGVLDKAGRRVARVPFDAALIGQAPPVPGLAKRLSSVADARFVQESDDGVARFYGFAHSARAAGLVAYVGLARDAAFAAEDRLFLRRIALLVSAFALAALAASWFGSYAVRRPIMNLRRAMQRVAAGDLAVRAEVGSGIEELAELAASFNDMAARRRHAEGQQRILLRELNHRMKNSFAAIRSIAAQTLSHTNDEEEFRRAFEGRLAALSRASTLLASGDWQAADLRDLIEATLKPFRTDANLRLRGPRVTLASQAALTLGLALHELATNAAKYGAFATPEGRVEIAWAVQGAGETRLILDWSEEGGPPVQETERRGFGRSLIERSVAYELDGSAELTFAPAGVRCHIEVLLGHQAGEEPVRTSRRGAPESSCS
jgi:two-component sensor histidine kinase